MSANEAQIDYWNGEGGERFARAQEAIDRSFAKITEAAMAFAAPAPDERALDIGCGAGTTTFRLRERVGAGGAAAGVDVSARLLHVARARADAGHADVAFVEDDAATHDFQPVFDLVFSRFGVMFFDDPVSAFKNIRGAIAPSGRLAFVCWRSLAENTWAHAPLMAAKPFLPPTDPPDPTAPGPFAFADGTRLSRILRDAGFQNIEIEKLDSTMGMGETPEEAVTFALSVGPVARQIADLDQAAQQNIREALAKTLSEYQTPEGIRPPAACWLVRARL